jgi:hypothetical protein
MLYPLADYVGAVNFLARSVSYILCGLVTFVSYWKFMRSSVGSGFKGDVDRTLGFLKHKTKVHMKAFITEVSISFLATNIAVAQNYDSLNINNVTSSFHSNGDCLYGSSFWNSITTPTDPIDFSVGSLWIGGLDNNGQLRVTAGTYRQSGEDFWAGPLDTSIVVCTPAQNAFYDRVWKINKTTIDSFRLGLFSITPPSITQWPGNGNQAAGEARTIAPYVDVNGDQTYNPVNGDYPLIRGDQAIFFVFNDTLQGQPHGDSGGRRLGIEIRALAYAVNCSQDSALHNTIFVTYDVINRTSFTYDSLYCGLWTDFDLIPSFTQNAVGCDSLGNGYYYYNRIGDAVGVTLLNQPMNFFMTSHNNFSATGNPTEPEDFYGFLQGEWKDSSQLLYWNSNLVTNMAYTGDPYTASGWLSPTASNDFRGIASFGPNTILPGQKFNFTVAYTYAHDYTGDSIYETVIVRDRMHSISQYFSNDSTPCGANITAVAEITEKDQLEIFPNPATSSINVHSSSGTQTYCIFDVAGNEVLTVRPASKNFTVDISSLAPGIYILRMTSSKEITTARFVKLQ